MEYKKVRAKALEVIKEVRDEKTFSKDIVKEIITTQQQYIDKKRIITILSTN
jgi:hypothetical protein